MNKKTLIICVVSCLVILSAVSAVYAYSSINWSEPTRADGKPIVWEQSNNGIVQGECPREEYNIMFEDYREGLVTKEDMKEYVRYCK